MIESSLLKQLISLTRSLWSWRTKNPWHIRKLNGCSRTVRIIKVCRPIIRKNLNHSREWRVRQLKTLMTRIVNRKWMAEDSKTERNQNLLKKLKFKVRREADLQSLAYQINIIEGSRPLIWMIRSNITIFWIWKENKEFFRTPKEIWTSNNSTLKRDGHVLLFQIAITAQMASVQLTEELLLEQLYFRPHFITSTWSKDQQ